MPLACPESNRGMQMHFSARACYIASAVCAAVAVFAFFGVGNDSDDRSLQMQPTTTRRGQTTSAATRLERVEEERTRLANELRNAQTLERKQLQERVDALDAELKQMRVLLMTSKQDTTTLRTLSKDLAQIAGSVASVVSVMLAFMGRRRQSTA
jgi:flagellar motility protein MotE (MotC chaperone)